MIDSLVNLQVGPPGNSISAWVPILTVLFVVPAGFLFAWLAKDEEWFRRGG